jgi:hypothetical protein
MSPPEDKFDDFDDDAQWNYVPKKVRHLEPNPIPLSPHQEAMPLHRTKRRNLGSSRGNDP